MNRALFFVLGAVAIVCVAAVTAQAAVIPMTYNNTTSTVLLDWDMEGAGTPAVGSVTYRNAGTASTGIVTGGGSEPAAYEGSQMVRSDRPDSGGNTGFDLDFGSVGGASDVTTTTMAFRAADANGYFTLGGGTLGSGVGADMAWFYFAGTGGVNYYDSGWVDTGLTHNVGAWNELVLTHTNGTGNWTISVNGSSASANTSDDANLTSRLGVLGAFAFDNGFYPSTIHLDAVVPEPSSLVLLAAGLMGLLAYAWRKRK